MWLWGLAFKICRVGWLAGDWRPREEPVSQPESKGTKLAEVPLPWGRRPSPDWIRPTHILEGNLLYSEPTALNVNIIWKNLHSNTRVHDWSATWVLWPTQVDTKINHQGSSQVGYVFIIKDGEWAWVSGPVPAWCCLLQGSACGCHPCPGSVWRDGWIQRGWQRFWSWATGHRANQGERWLICC